MTKEVKRYLKFVDPQDEKKYYIYQFVRGTDDMSMYAKGIVVGKKTIFDNMNAQAQMPLSILKRMIHADHELVTYDTYDEMEADLFMERLLEF